ncbi:hypothetical protein [Legionella jamestowniensis]|uniref:Uncharacterized protein n=1 Tax=Legionella jamestowniensis TaxID=455 RepID=A0A0W0UZF9_9GAMM|nr:hypothetical protein [Legionella jamestowniensis]KTD13243.1 hypothetical protein Ljam_0033 [Legionella jamestowniensis]SFL78192.1 hypothetical protein SAMN02746073_1895 [Legionella jamestowniensis DSM 19215]
MVASSGNKELLEEVNKILSDTSESVPERLLSLPQNLGRGSTLCYNSLTKRLYVSGYSGLNSQVISSIEELFKDMDISIPRFGTISTQSEMSFGSNTEEVLKAIDIILTTIPNPLIPNLETKNYQLGYNRLIKIQLLLGGEPKVKPVYIEEKTSKSSLSKHSIFANEDTIEPTKSRDKASHCNII